MTSRDAASADTSAEGGPPATVTRSGNATVSDGGIANTGILTYQQAPEPPPEWPLRVGQVPALASAFQGRPGLRDQIAEARAAGTRTDSSGGAAGTTRTSRTRSAPSGRR